MILIITGIGFLVIVLRTAYIAWFSPISAFPNAHFLAPFTSLWILWIKATKREIRLRNALHEKLGPVVRIGPSELSVNDAGIVKTVYKGGFDKTEYFQAFTNFGEKVMFSTIESKPHSERRRILSHLYSKSHIQTSPELSEILDTITSNFRSELCVYAEEDRALDIYKLTKAYGMDVTSAYSLGLGLGTNFIQESRTSDPLEIFELGLSPEVLFHSTEISPRVFSWVEQIAAKLFLRENSAAWQSVEDLVYGLCEKAKGKIQEKAGRSDSIDEEEGRGARSHPTVYAQLYSKLRGSGNIPSEKLDNTTAAEMLDHMLAGNEGIGIILSYLSWELSAHQEIQQRLQEEVKNSFRTLEDGAKLPSAQILDTLPVLDAVLQETMRLYPSGFGPFPRAVPSQGAQIGGVNLPAGTVVSSSAYSLHRNATVFPSPEEWKPERWIDIGEEERREMMRWFWVFGSGGRMCIGNHLTIRMMKAWIAAVFAEFGSVLLPEARMPRQVDGLMGIPEGNKVFMRFRKLA